VNARTAFKTALVITAITTAAPGVNPAHGGEDVRAALSSYQLSALDGTETTLGSYRGAPCRKELPVMNQWHEAWTPRGGRVVAISVDSDLRKARRFAADAKLTLTVLHDGPDGLARAIDIPSLPCTFLLDRDGRVVSVVRSSSQESLEALHKEAEKLLNRPANPGVQSAGMGGSQ
jgi:peroxiredoxin